MTKKYFAILLFTLLFVLQGCGNQTQNPSEPESVGVIAEEKEEQAPVNHKPLQLHPLDTYESMLHDETEWHKEMLEESNVWKSTARLLDENTYGWISDAKKLIVQYFADTFAEDISQQVSALEVYATEMSEVFAGFHGGDGKIYLQEDELQKDRILHITIHEMIHGLGVDFYNDKNGILSNAFYEGCTETVTQYILKKYGYPFEDVSAYDALMEYGKMILDADAELLTDVVIKGACDIAKRIDDVLGEGVGSTLLKSQTLLASGEDAPEIFENCKIIMEAYQQAFQ